MIHKIKLLPSDWLESIKKFDPNKVTTVGGQEIARVLKNFVLEKKETIISSDNIQYFITSVLASRNEMFQDYNSVPTSIIQEVFSEIGGEKGLGFCEKLDSTFIELIAFRDILQKNGFNAYEVSRKSGSSDFFIKKYCLTYEAEVKFKRADQALHRTIEHLIIGKSMIKPSFEKTLIGKKININIKLSPDEINNSSKSRIYKTVEKWSDGTLQNYSDSDIEIMVVNGDKEYFFVNSSDIVRSGIFPKEEDINHILSPLLLKIKKQFEKRKPKRSIGIIVWDTPWNYNFEEKEKMEKILIESIKYSIVNANIYSDRLYIYPYGLKKILSFKYTNGVLKCQPTSA